MEQRSAAAAAATATATATTAYIIGKGKEIKMRIFMFRKSNIEARDGHVSGEGRESNPFQDDSNN